MYVWPLPTVSFVTSLKLLFCAVCCRLFLNDRRVVGVQEIVFNTHMDPNIQLTKLYINYASIKPNMYKLGLYKFKLNMVHIERKINKKRRLENSSLCAAVFYTQWRFELNNRIGVLTGLQLLREITAEAAVNFATIWSWDKRSPDSLTFLKRTWFSEQNIMAVHPKVITVSAVPAELSCLGQLSSCQTYPNTVIIWNMIKSSLNARQWHIKFHV